MKRKSSEESISSDSNAPDVLEPPIQQPTDVEAPRITKRVVQRSEWVERVSQPATPAQATASREGQENQEGATILVDPIDYFLEGLDRTVGYILRVDRLTSFHADGRRGVRAPKQFCRMYTFTAEALLAHEHLEAIQNEFRDGAYWLTLRSPDGEFIRQWDEHIATNFAQPQTQTPQAPIFQPLPQSQTAVEQLTSLASVARELQTIREVMGWNSPPAPPLLEPTPAPPPAVEKPIEEKLIDALLNRVVKDGDDSTLDKVLTYLSPKSESSDFMSMLAEFVKPLAPVLGELALRAYNSYASGPVPPGQPQPQNLLTQAPASAVDNPTTVTGPGTQTDVQSQSEFARKSIFRLYSRLAEDCLENVDQNASVDRTLNLLEKYPEFAPNIGQLITVPPSVVLKELSRFVGGVDFSLIAHSEQWIADYQGAMKTAGELENESTTQSTSGDS